MHQQHYDLPAQATRLHLSEMPAPLPEAIIASLTEELSQGHLYPEPGSPAATAALARLWSVPEESVVVTNGCDEAILYAYLKLARGGTALLARNSYTGYRELANLANQAVVEVPLANWSVDIAGFATAMDASTRIALISNPHNPTGSLLPPSQITHFAGICAAKNVIAIVDEAYLDFAPKGESAVHQITRFPNLLVLKSFAKSYGLAGIRLGAAIGAPRHVQLLKQAAECNPFSVNRLAQRVALELSSNAAEFSRRSDEIIRTREFVESQLQKMGIWFNKSSANFVFMKAPARLSAAEFLSRTGFLVRDCDTYGLEGFWRVSCATREKMEAFVKSLDGVISATERRPCHAQA